MFQVEVCKPIRAVPVSLGCGRPNRRVAYQAPASRGLSLSLSVCLSVSLSLSPSVSLAFFFSFCLALAFSLSFCLSLFLSLSICFARARVNYGLSCRSGWKTWSKPWPPNAPSCVAGPSGDAAHTRERRVHPERLAEGGSARHRHNETVRE